MGIWGGHKPSVPDRCSWFRPLLAEDRCWRGAAEERVWAVGGRRGEEGAPALGRLPPRGASQRVGMGLLRATDCEPAIGCLSPMPHGTDGELKPRGGEGRCPPVQTKAAAATSLLPSLCFPVGRAPKARPPPSQVPLGLSASLALGAQAPGRPRARLGGKGCQHPGSEQAQNLRVTPAPVRVGPLFQEVSC